MTNRTSFYITRLLIGACEGGFIPGVILFTTYFYKSKELSIRLALFWSTLNIARVISALLAAGILEMRGVGGKSGWFWLFLIEGLLTFVVGAIVSFLARSFGTRIQCQHNAELHLPPRLPNIHQKRHIPQILVHRARGSNHDKRNYHHPSTYSLIH